MSKRLIFKGEDSDFMTAETTLYFGSTDTLSFKMRAYGDVVGSPTADSYALISDTAGNDILVLRSDRIAPTFKFELYHNSSWYHAGSGTSSSTSVLFDGDEHTVSITRTASTWALTIDGALMFTLSSTSSSDFEIDNLFHDPNTGESMPIEIWDLVIGSESYPITDSSPTLWVNEGVGWLKDFSPDDAEPSLVTQGEWEWVGDFQFIDKSYSSPNGEITELRKIGVRRRCMVGYDMGDDFLKEAGDDASTVSGYNGGVESILTPVSGVTVVNCLTDNCAPILGTSMYWQTQTWRSLNDSVA